MLSVASSADGLSTVLRQQLKVYFNKKNECKEREKLEKTEREKELEELNPDN